MYERKAKLKMDTGADIGKRCILLAGLINSDIVHLQFNSNEFSGAKERVGNFLYSKSAQFV